MPEFNTSLVNNAFAQQTPPPTQYAILEIHQDDPASFMSATVQLRPPLEGQQTVILYEGNEYIALVETNYSTMDIVATINQKLGLT